jgi:hypothetical protein
MTLSLKKRGTENRYVYSGCAGDRGKDIVASAVYRLFRSSMMFLVLNNTYNGTKPRVLYTPGPRISFVLVNSIK